MKNHSGTKGPNASDEAHVIHPQTAARLRFIEARYATERWVCSPRACVAFSALSACIRLREKLGDLAKRSRLAAPVRRGRANSIQPSTP